MTTPVYKTTWQGKTKVFIETTKKLKKGSPTSIQAIADITCDKIDSLRTGTLLGKGREGEVYCYLNECEYVVKIQEYLKDSLETLQKEKRKTNKAHEAGLAPKIYKVIPCRKQKTIITVMDKVQGKNLLWWIINKKLTEQDIEKFFKEVDNLHKLGLFHGDLNPQNIMYDGKNFMFIDFNIIKNYKPEYDFATLFYYIYLAHTDEIIAYKIMCEAGKRLAINPDRKIQSLLNVISNKNKYNNEKEWYQNMLKKSLKFFW